MKCRHCFEVLKCDFIDLGYAPPSNAYLEVDALSQPETYYPLRVKVCHKCWLVQTEDYADPEKIFDSGYAYFSSVSKTWLEHAESYTKKMIPYLGLNRSSFVVEIASNDGYLLKNFVEEGIPCLGIEPTKSTAEAAEKIGVPVLQEFFGENLADQLVRKNKKADLVIGNNVYAHVPDINDFTCGLKKILKEEGTITLEFPHLQCLIEEVQFDTIYHEHFSYLSLSVVKAIFESQGLRIYDVECLPTHGGSLRVYGCHEHDLRPTNKSVELLLAQEEKGGLRDMKTYELFQSRAQKIKNDLLKFLIEQKAMGKKVAAYGAAAKGNTLLNYAGVKPDLLSYVCDASSFKQGKFMPGSHLPIKPPEEIKRQKPDYVLILPWNLKNEIMQQLDFVFDWGGQFVSAVPELTIE